MLESGVNATEFAAQLLNTGFAPQIFARKGAGADARANSVWCGAEEALVELGLRQGAEVRVCDLAAVISGRHVCTGARVLPRSSVFFDLVFPAPNSLSIQWYQSSPEHQADIEDAMLESASVLLGHLVRNHSVVGGVRRARSFVASLVLHAVGTRSMVDGAFPAPILHVHCCLFGVWDEDEGLTGPHEATLCAKGIQRECNAVGGVELADRLMRLGFKLRNTEGTGSQAFEIVGVPQELLDHPDLWKNTGCGVARAKTRASDEALMATTAGNPAAGASRARGSETVPVDTRTVTLIAGPLGGMQPGRCVDWDQLPPDARAWVEEQADNDNEMLTVLDGDHRARFHADWHDYGWDIYIVEIG